MSWNGRLNRRTLLRGLLGGAVVTIGLPVLIMIGFGVAFQWLRRRRFSRPLSSSHPD